MNLKHRILISILTSLLLYLLASFVVWDITIIKRLPTVHPASRFGALLTFGTIQFLVQMLFPDKKI